MNCPKCDAPMENKAKKNKNNGLGCAIVLLVLTLIIFVPVLINSIKDYSVAVHEGKLIEEGKTVSADVVINEVIEVLKNRDKEKLKTYLSDNFEYFGNDNSKSKITWQLWSDLGHLKEENYDIEERGNSIKNQETYRVYWNVVEANKKLGRTHQNYCLQKITIILKRVVKQNVITYEIEKIIITDN